MKNPELATKLLNSMAKKNAIKSFQTALTVSAYQDFLGKHNVDISSIKTVEDFAKLPVIDKSNYIRKYSLEEILKDSNMYNHYTIERSSGYTGEPHYWPRLVGQDDGVESKLAIVFDSLFQTKTKSTLVLNTFALGTWIAGTKFGRFMLNSANNKDMKMTVINTGVNAKEAVEMWLRFYKHYDQTIIAGYNPFLKELLELAKSEGFPLKEHHIHAIVGGESFSESWRDYVADLIGSKVDDYDQKIISGYGASDMGSDLGFEYPFSIYLRRLLTENKDLRHKLFGENMNEVPMIFQYAPHKVWVEVIDGELVFTANNSIPMVRYNMHDRGGVMTYATVMETLKDVDGIEEIKKKLNVMPLPFLYLWGRSDGTVTILGAKVFDENIRTAVTQPELQSLLTGRYYAYSDYDKKMKQAFHIVCESTNVDESVNNLPLLTKLVTDSLRLHNTEFASAYSGNSKIATPVLNFITKKSFDEYIGESIKIKSIKK